MILASLNQFDFVKRTFLWPFLFLDYYAGRGLFAVFTSIFYFTVQHWASYTTGGVSLLVAMLAFIVSCCLRTSEGSAPHPRTKSAAQKSSEAKAASTFGDGAGAGTGDTGRAAAATDFDDPSESRGAAPAPAPSASASQKKARDSDNPFAEGNEPQGEWP